MWVACALNGTLLVTSGQQKGPYYVYRIIEDGKVKKILKMKGNAKLIVKTLRDFKITHNIYFL
jgi:hypothetical protein